MHCFILRKCSLPFKLFCLSSCAYRLPVEKSQYSINIHTQSHTHEIFHFFKGTFISQPSGQLTCSTPELRAQFQPHQSNQKEVTTPGKHVLLPEVPCQNGCGQSLETTGRLLSWLPTMQVCEKEKEARYSGQLFNT